MGNMGGFVVLVDVARGLTLTTAKRPGTEDGLRFPGWPLRIPTREMFESIEFIVDPELVCPDSRVDLG
jgi:hypothetical protein